MQIKRETVELKQEKNIIIGCIVSDKFIKDLYRVTKDLNLLVSPELRLLGGWCLDYYEKYNTAPKETIGDIYEVEKAGLKPHQVVYIEGVLSHLSEEYMDNEFNSDFYFTNAKRYLDERNLTIVSEKVKGLATRGETEKAYSLLQSVKKVDNPVGSGVDVLNDESAIDKMFEASDSDVFHIPGDIGKSIQGKYRGDVMGVAGRQKLGKTFMLNELAKWAVLDSKKVSYFTFEMKDVMMTRRLFANFTASKFGSDGEPVVMPFFRELSNGKFDIDFDFQRVNSLNKIDCIKKQKALKVHSHGGGLRLFDPSDLPDSKDMMEAIDYKISNLIEYDNYMTDVLILDYDAIIPAPYREERDRLDHVWQYAKKLATKYNILVILASQNNKQTFTRDAEAEDVSGDSRKLGHVSHLITLNQTPQEKKAYLLRVKVMGRHGDVNSLDEVVCLQNLSIGKAVIDSKLKANINNYKEWVENMNNDQFGG